DQNLLLIATGEIDNAGALVGRPDIHPLDELTAALTKRREVDDAQPVGIAPERRGADIVGNAVREEEPTALAVFGQIDDAPCERGGRVGNLYLLALEPEASG